MPRVFKSVARTDRYKRGLKIEDPKTKNGFRIDRSKPADEKDTLFCKKGETYFYWAFRFGPTIYSTKHPRRSQLTQSEFFYTVYSLIEEIEDANIDDFIEESDSLQNWVQEKIDSFNEILDELNEKESNLSGYEGLANSPVYETITERIEAVENFISELESIDCDIEFVVAKSEDDDSDEVYTEEEAEEKNRELVDEKLQEIKDLLFEL